MNAKNPVCIRVEFDSKPIRHIAVQCPFCSSWFHGCDITDNELFYDYDIYGAKFRCPICERNFGGGTEYNTINIEESSYPEMYEDCLKKTVKWEKVR